MQNTGNHAMDDAGESHAAGILLTHGDRALFLKRSDKAVHPGEWCCPGGSIEAGETPEQAAHREMQEETGYPAGDVTQIDEGDGFVTFRGNVDAEFDPTLNDEHTEYRWAPLTDPPQPLHPGVRATLDKLLAKAGAQDLREWDTNGWFEVFDNPLSKVGVYQYSEASIRKGGDRNKMVGVYRPAEELGSEECINSFRLMPWTDDHPSDLFGDKAQGFASTEEKGVRGVIGEQVYFKDGTLYGNLKVFSEQLARKIAGGKRELSCGYHCDFVAQEGVYNGEAYQYVQRNMRGNHVASVTAGRMGSEVRVLDAVEKFTFALDMKAPAAMEKITRASFLYMAPRPADVKPDLPKGKFAQCITCQWWIPGKDRCVQHSEGDKIDGDDSCGVYSPMTTRDKDAKPLGLVTPQESGLVSRKVRCENCMFFDPTTEARKHCDFYTQLNRVMPQLFDLDRYVDEHGCCNAQTPGERDPQVFGPFGPLDPDGEAMDSKEHATKVAGESAAEKGMTGHHSTTDGDSIMANKTEEEIKKEAADRKAARDARRSARDAARDSMSAEEESAEDAKECAEDAEEEKDDEKDESKEAKDRGRARDRRAGARDSRKGARDKKAAQDAAAIKAAADAAAAAGKGLDAAEVTALVNKAIAGVKVPSAEEIVAQVRPAIRKEEAAKAALYGRVSPMIGAFDHAEMTHVDMATYALDKLGAPKATDPVSALDFYLAGRSQVVQPARFAQDAAGETHVDRYLNS